MITSLVLTNEVSREVGRLLDLLLADEYLFDKIIRDYGRNVAGPDSVELHRQFQQQHEDILQWIDGVTKRAQEIRLGSLDLWSRVKKPARFTALPGSGLPLRRMLAELFRLHEVMLARLRTDLASCTQRYGDPTTAGILAGLAEQHEKAAVLLHARLDADQRDAAWRTLLSVAGFTAAAGPFSPPLMRAAGQA